MIQLQEEMIHAFFAIMSARKRRESGPKWRPGMQCIGLLFGERHEATRSTDDVRRGVSSETSCCRLSEPLSFCSQAYGL